MIIVIKTPLEIHEVLYIYCYPYLGKLYFILIVVALKQSLTTKSISLHYKHNGMFYYQYYLETYVILDLLHL